MSATILNIDDLIGVKYRRNGRSILEGFDCYGYLIEFEKRLGHFLPDFAAVKKRNYDTLECEQICLTFLKLKGTPLKEVVAPQKLGDIVFFKDNKGVLFHVGGYLGDGFVTHCNKYGVHIEKLSNMSSSIGKVYTWQ